MTKNLESLLNRRSDLSTFLVHLTRDTCGRTALSNLCQILDQRKLVARTAYGPVKDTGPDVPDQHVVCFSETPLEHIWTHCELMEGRQVDLQPYGVAFTKGLGRRQGANPVWYTDISPTGNEWLMSAINELVEHARQNAAAGAVFRLTPFIEQMGPTKTGRKEFWWEREWRHVGDFHFAMSSVFAVLAPVEHHGQLAQLIAAGCPGGARRPPILDPRWSPDRMLGVLSGLMSDAGPIPDPQAHA